ncbi:MAG TPA: M20/M25/M40 family metallo-hydrolase [Gaiellaceae bacterium]|nr:M20/M25/M40 family metallo-hydrolase [Gaiellaceae bacterium]
MRETPDPAWLDELFEWLRIPSVSADPAHAGDVRRAGEWLRDFVRAAGGEAEVVETSAQPLVVGEIAASANAAAAPTTLLYGHFDVQPPAPLELWESHPFEPELRDGYLYGRGAVDDKGNSYLMLKAARLLAEEGALPVNVRVAFDGEEEIGGHSIVDFLAADDRGADACLIFDSGMSREDAPSFDLGVRGLVFFHVELRSGERDLHSGMFGGAAMNAVHALAQTLDAVVPPPEELRAGAIPPAKEEVASWAELDHGASVLAAAGATPADGRGADEFYLRTFAEPAVDVNGISGGEARLQKTVLPVHAEANVSIRLAPGQDAAEIAAAFERLLREAAPRGAVLEVERRSSSPAGLVPPDAPAVRLAQDAFERALGRRPLLLRSGGTIPIVPALTERGIPTILTGFALPGANIHSPNERLLARYVPLGVAAARETLLAFADLPRRAAPAP